MLLLVCLVSSITLGAADIPIDQYFDILCLLLDVFIPTPNYSDSQITAIADCHFSGVALAVSGALMQGLTRNPLADSGILGI